MTATGASTSDHSQAILEVGSALVSSLQLDEALAGVAGKIGEAMGVSCAEIWTCSREPRAATFAAFWSAAAATPEGTDGIGTVIGLDERPDFRRLIEGEEAIERHIDDPDLPADVRTRMEQRGYQSVLGMPLRVGDEAIGVLSVFETGSARRFTPVEVELLGRLCRFAAIGINNAELFRRQEEQQRRLVSLLQSSRTMAASVSAQESIQSMRVAIASLMAGSECRIDVHLRGDDGSFQRFLPQPSEAAVELEQLDPIAQKALESRRPMMAQLGGKRTRVVVPVVFKGEPSGYVDLSGRLARQISADEVSYLQILANQTAVAIENARLFSTVERQAAVDTVTGLHSRWYFYERLYSECARSYRYKQPLALVMVEIDGFEAYAEKRGQTVADDVLRAVGRLMSRDLRRRVDVACRHGACEFAILMPNTHGWSPGAALAAERLRVTVEKTEFRNEDHDALGVFTLSLGVADYPSHADDADELAEAAGKALQAARKAGGNKVKLYVPPE